MGINIVFKYRVQIFCGYKGDCRIIRERFCFMRKEDAIRCFNRKKILVETEEVLFLEYRSSGTDKFREVDRYEIDKKKELLEA